MTLHTTFLLVRWGFTLTYLAFMNVLIVVAMPLFNGIERLVIQFVLTPLAVIGIAMLIVGRIAKTGPHPHSE